MAHKKGVGSTDNGRDSKSKRLGVKLFGGQHAKAGNILVRQRGTKYHAGLNVYMGKDYTLHASVEGHVFYKKGRKDRTIVGIHPLETVVTPTPPVGPTPVTPEPEKPTPVTPPIKPEVEPVAEAGPVKIGGKKWKINDLKMVEGIGPKIAEILTAAGIDTWAKLAETTVDRLKEVLAEAGNRYKAHDPTTWPQQAKLAAEGKYDELTELMDKLHGGRVPEEEGKKVEEAPKAEAAPEEAAPENDEAAADASEEDTAE